MLIIITEVVDALESTYKCLSRENINKYGRLNVVKQLIGAALLSAKAAKLDIQNNKKGTF